MADGGVFESNEASLFESIASMSVFSSSESGFARFFGFGAALAAAFGAALVVFSVVCLVAFGLAGAAAFLGAAFAF